MISRTLDDANRLREELRQQAKQEADRIIANAERQIQLETRRALNQIRHEAVDLSIAIASKILRRTISKEDNQRLIGDVVRQLDATCPN